VAATGTSPRTLEESLGRAYVYLGKRDRTIAQMRAHLARADASAELIEETLAELIEQGYLDDARYAGRFAEDRRKLDGWGTQRIYRRLLELGVEREQAQLATRVEDGEDELEFALQLLRERVKGALEDPRARQRALGLLLRRGYEQDVAYEAVRRLAGE
jgi:regulatory protein